MPVVPRRLRRVVRRLLRAPLFTSVAIVTLALGIGANTAIFSVVRGVLLRPLPFDHPDELVGVWHTAPGLGFPVVNQSPATYLTYRENGNAFEDIGLWDSGAVSVTGTGEPERVDDLMVTDGTLVVEGRSREIIGVLPASFRFMNFNPQLVLPFRIDRREVFV